nr:uncharacterized protein LOC123289864 [Equus asinus]
MTQTATNSIWQALAHPASGCAASACAEVGAGPPFLPTSVLEHVYFCHVFGNCERLRCLSVSPLALSSTSLHQDQTSLNPKGLEGVAQLILGLLSEEIVSYVAVDSVASCEESSVSSDTNISSDRLAKEFDSNARVLWFRNADGVWSCSHLKTQLGWRLGRLLHSHIKRMARGYCVQSRNLQEIVPGPGKQLCSSGTSAHRKCSASSLYIKTLNYAATDMNQELQNILDKII